MNGLHGMWQRTRYKNILKKIDILILNHGINNSSQNDNYLKSIDINALSKFKFLKLFEEIAQLTSQILKEIW